MHAYAQTNIQLYNQLRAAGRPEADLLAVRAAYECAMRLFTGQFRGSGKPFLAHLVGTASILATIEAPFDSVMAGLLHAAYADGEFGDGTRGINEAKRAALRGSIGGAAEDLVAAYLALAWNDRALAAILAGTDPPPEREVLRIRLANELEDHLDLQVLYCRDAKQGEGTAATRLDRCRALAERAGWPALAAAFAIAGAELAAAAPPGGLRTDRRYSFVLPPASHVPRLRVAWRYPLTSRAVLMRGWSRVKRRVRGFLAG